MATNAPVKIIPSVLALVSACVVTGCATPLSSSQPAHLSRANLGMNKVEVARAAGRPVLAALVADGLEACRYSERMRANSTSKYYGVVLKGGQVIDYEPETGVRLDGQLAVQELFGNSWMQIQQPHP